MPEIIRTNSKNPQFVLLIKELDRYLSEVNGEKDDFYRQYNGIDLLNHVVIVQDNGLPIACGAIKEIGKGMAEVKRMYTHPTQRRKGLASQVLKSLEQWAAEMGFHKCVLETGSYMPDSIALYERNGYRNIANYGQYVGMTTSVCFEKKLVIL